MVQMFHVVKCFYCDCFQVQQVKKVKKWTCKLCGEKQSLLKEFGGGSAVDCRRHVQKLNAARGAALEERDTLSLWKRQEEETGSEDRQDEQVVHPQVSRWSKYVAAPNKDDAEDMLRFQGNSTIDRKRKRDDGSQTLTP
ncbi:MRN complex-interacting protein isoform X2 [Festucalex cinctus]